MTLYELVLLLNDYLIANEEISFTSLVNTLQTIPDVVSYDVDTNIEVEVVDNPWRYEPYVTGAMIGTITIYSNTEYNYTVKIKHNKIESVERQLNISYIANTPDYYTRR